MPRNTRQQQVDSGAISDAAVHGKLLDLQNRLNALESRQPTQVWRVTQQGNFASTTFAAITWEDFTGAGSSSGIPVVSGATYLLRGMVVVVMGGTASNQLIRFTGPSITFMAIGFQSIEGGAVWASGVQNAVGTNMSTGAFGGGTIGEFKFEGIFNPSANGTLGMQGACSNGSNPWAAQGGTYMELTQLL